MSLTAADSKRVPPAISDTPATAYQQRLDEFNSTIRQLQQSERRYVRFRVAVFLVAVCTGIICLGDSRISSWWLLLPAILFAVLLPLHSACVRRLNRCRNIQSFYEECLERLAHNWNLRPSDGARFISSAHPWSVDLDLFGVGSLFQMVSECRTSPGQERLAGWMTESPTADDILLRQTRSAALRDDLQLRESLAVISDRVDWNQAAKLLTEWAQAPAQRISSLVRWGSTMTGLLAVPTVVGVLLGYLPDSCLLLLMVLQGPLILVTRRQIRQVFLSMDSVDKALQQLSEILVVLETWPFTDPSVRSLQAELSTGGELASTSIRRLSSMTRWLNHSLRNQFFAPIAWMCGLLIQLTDRLEHWREMHGQDVGRWLSATAEFEALVSVAAFRFDHPGFSNPVISSDVAVFEASQLGHPLLAPQECVRNDVSLTATVPLMLISGSNMSGKSTLLRSVGTNLVLTFCGAVVNAEKLTTYPFQMCTAMRISDSLQEGRSLFFSVVQRLKSVVELTQQQRTVLFLLDEILHGTNSHDRQRGAEGVIRSLVNRHALGMVTTHDLALTRIVDSLEGRGINKHFEDVIVDGKMSFDYRLRDGVVQRSNALELMRMMGLDV